MSTNCAPNLDVQPSRAEKEVARAKKAYLVVGDEKFLSYTFADDAEQKVFGCGADCVEKEFYNFCQLARVSSTFSPPPSLHNNVCTDLSGDRNSVSEHLLGFDTALASMFWNFVHSSLDLRMGLARSTASR